MKKLFGVIVCSALLFSCSDKPATAEDTESKIASDVSSTESRDYELGDNKFVEIAKKALDNLEGGDIDGWIASFADNAVYHWNNYDSVTGKAAITDYWKKRRTDIIDSISFTKKIWLPIKVKTPLTEGQQTGNYALSWHVTYAKYKTGKSMTQRIHT